MTKSGMTMPSGLQPWTRWIFKKIITICSIRDGVQRMVRFLKFICFHHHSEIIDYTD